MTSLNTRLRWGVTLATVDDAARAAVRLAGVPGDWTDQYDTAHSDICLFLYETDHCPSYWRLVDVGRDGIWEAQRTHRRHHGYQDRDYTHGPGSSSGFRRYWSHPDRHGMPTPAVDRATDHLAVTQIMPMLSRSQRDALVALAAYDDYDRAAESLAVTVKGFTSLIAKGRRQFLFWWHEGERPSRLWRRDRRVWSRVDDPQRRATLFGRTGAAA